jgi:hypothetical protein
MGQVTGIAEDVNLGKMSEPDEETLTAWQPSNSGSVEERDP